MKNLNREKGQSLVELSISLVILLYLLSGAVEFGIAFFQYVQLRDAAQEGALFGSMQPANTTGIVSRIQGSSNSPIDLTTITPVIEYSDPSRKCEGETITVRLSYDHQIFMPFMPQLLGQNAITLNAVVTDTILSPVCP